MMNVLILDGPRDPRAATYPQYRGTYRAHPTYCDGLSKDHELNKLFFWFLEEGGELGVVHNFAKASQYAELLNMYKSKFSMKFTSFEVVEVTDNNAPASHNRKLLGFDLSAGYNNSLLVSGLRYSANTQLPFDSIQELYSLLGRYYAPQLNAAGLFDTFEVAAFCLRSMTALQNLSPNIFEGGDLSDFQPVGLHVIEDLIRPIT